MKLFNTLSRSLEDFKPIDNALVKMYSCGPTVYDNAHIGNLASYIYADTLKRTLKYSGYNVVHVMNYTDVDDKTIKASQNAYKGSEPKQALQKFTEQYIDKFNNDLESVGVDTKDIQFVKATDHIQQMQSMILKLYKNGVAYKTDDGIYFSIENYKKFGKKYGQLLTLTYENTSSARIQNDEYDKDSVHDFALWKAKKDNEPSWNFDIDGKNIEGRPGWHIECSAMSESTLGIPFDIHTGGVDLIFPHHENEIAQSTAAKDNGIMANFFVHSNHLLVDGHKMSKSAGNFYTLNDIISKGFDPLAFRLLVLQSHYSKQSNFSWELLQAAQNRLNNLKNLADLRFQYIKSDSYEGADIKEYMDIIVASLSNDLNTPKALSAVGGIESNIPMPIPDFDDAKNDFEHFLQTFDALFGLKLTESHDITKEQKTMIADRENARDNKQWAQSDVIRDKLQSQGIEINDTQAGPVWSRN